MLFVLIVVVVLLVLIVFWLLFKTADERDNRATEDAFYRDAVQVINRLQCGSDAGVEKLLAEIMEADSEKRDIYVIFGNVLREKGFIGEAIKVHKSVLHRPNLPDTFKGWALSSLAEDFRMSGMLDRAVRTYNDAFNLNPSDNIALQRYAHLCKQVGDYTKLLSLMEVMASNGILDDNRYRMEVAFIYNEQGELFLREANKQEALRLFNKALQLNSRVYPAYMNLVRLTWEDDRNKRKCLEILHKLFERVPEKAFIGLTLYREIAPEDFEERCSALLARNGEDWRTRLQYARFLADEERNADAFEQFMEAVKVAPHVLLIHQEVWKFLLKIPDRQQYLLQYAKVSDQTMVFNAPFMCVECRYKSSEFLWKCPSCFGWNTFVESKI